MIPLRDENPSRTFPFVTYALIALNVAAWLWQWTLESRGVPIAVNLGLVPLRLLSDPVGEAYTIVSSMFLHGGLTHLGGNMLFLYIFGDNVEDEVGHARFLGFYLVAGVAAAAAQTLVDPASRIPMVGASGAIAGVLGAYLVLFPRAPVTVLNPMPLLWLFLGVVWVFPAWIVIGEFFLWNLWLGVLSIQNMTGGGVAFFAHLGGFVFGLLSIKFATRGRTQHESVRWEGWRPPPRGHQVRRIGNDGPRRDPWLS